ncbi:MAG TPA: GlsB/YeaQ/YmgE family stress response membrane protein [Acidimicrobiales bacterium]|nr:GlsB/YeaQ/YmgE family stress response membrane protein [Acidimicrobiales bacterium]
MSLIAMLIIGLFAGLLARLLVPGRDPMGLIATIVLGVVGSFVGGFLARALFDDTNGVRLFGATVGAVIVLLVWNAFVGRQRRGARGMTRRMVA